MVTDLLEQASLLGDVLGNEGLAAANAALSHSEWAQQKVQASRDGLVQGSNKLIEHEEWETIRAGRNTSSPEFLNTKCGGEINLKKVNR